MPGISDSERRKKVSFNAFYFEQNNPKNLGDMKDIFQHINEINLWGSTESASGDGSSAEQTKSLKLNMQNLFHDLQIKTLLDAPCGDFGWLSKITLNLEHYIGVDIIDNLIKNHLKNYKHESRLQFLLADITKNSLPISDLILCRDCLVHFSNEAIFKTLRNFKKTNSRYLLTTTFTRCQENVNIHNGDWRPINLELAPFNFPKPLLTINEECTESDGIFDDKSLGLWEIEKIT